MAKTLTLTLLTALLLLYPFRVNQSKSLLHGKIKLDNAKRGIPSQGSKVDLDL